MELTEKMQAEIVQAISTEIIELIIRRMENMFDVDDVKMKKKISINILTNTFGNFILQMTYGEGDKVKNFLDSWNEIHKIQQSWVMNACEHLKSGRSFTMKVINKNGESRNVE